MYLFIYLYVYIVVIYIYIINIRVARVPEIPVFEASEPIVWCIRAAKRPRRSPEPYMASVAKDVRAVSTEPRRGIFSLASMGSVDRSGGRAPVFFFLVCVCVCLCFVSFV